MLGGGPVAWARGARGVSLAEVQALLADPASFPQAVVLQNDVAFATTARASSGLEVTLEAGAVYAMEAGGLYVSTDTACALVPCISDGAVYGIRGAYRAILRGSSGQVLAGVHAAMAVGSAPTLATSALQPAGTVGEFMTFRTSAEFVATANPVGLWCAAEVAGQTVTLHGGKVWMTYRKLYGP